MKLVNNKKGMTLVEVIVVLLISSILLMIMGSLILNSFKYLNNTTDQDLSKRSMDSLSSYVRNELLYSSDVRVNTTVPEGENWRCFYVDKGKLYQDLDLSDSDVAEQVYSDSFYNNKDLKMTVSGYGNYRLDFSYSYSDEGEEIYRSKDTVELLNLKVKEEKDSSFDPFANIQKKVTLLNSTTKIYYQKAFQQQENPKPDDPTIGTVAEQINCISLHNNRYQFVSGGYYRYGDIVFHDEFWWKMVYEGKSTSSVVNEKPGTSIRYWKKIDALFDKTSAYEHQDIIMYDSKYYEAQSDISGTLIGITESPIPGSKEDKDKKWKEIDKPEKGNICKNERIEANKDSVIYKLQHLIDTNKFTLKDVPEYEKGKTYPAIVTPEKATDFVKILDEKLGVTYRYFIKMVDGYPEVAPGATIKANDPLVWQEIRIDWDANSYYAQKDVVFYATKDLMMGYAYVQDGLKVDKAGIKPALKDTPWAKKNVSPY